MQDNAPGTESWQSGIEPYEYPSAPLMMATDRSVEVDQLMGALAKAQGVIIAPERNKTVKVTPRSGGPAYTFKYATLSAIIEAIRKPFADNGLSRTQVINYERKEGFRLITTIWHESGQFISSTVPILIDAHANNQQFGSALTYMKRYALSALVGIAADEDDDGNAADGNEAKVVSEKPEVPQAQRATVQASPKPVSPNPILSPEPSHKPESVSTAQIPVQLLPDDSNSDWMKWGQEFIAAAKAMPDMKAMAELQKNNAIPLKNMEIYVPKMFSNMMVALIKIKKELEKA